MGSLSMGELCLLDTDVIIDFLRGQSEAVAFLHAHINALSTSTITVAELYAGVRDGKERDVMGAFISALTVFPITPAIAITGGLYRRDYGKSHGVGLADAIIAATAELESATLVTLNQKHFPMLEIVKVPYQK